MFPCHMAQIIERLVEAGVIAPENSEAAYQELEKYFVDRIGIIWTIRDLINGVAERGKSISPCQAKQVLIIAFDCCVDEPTTYYALIDRAFKMFPNLPDSTPQEQYDVLH